MERINIVGIGCAGKTTLARALAARLGVPHVELDALFWGPRWTPVRDEVFRSRVRDALAPDAWVADGGYQVARDIIWSRTDTVIWLDYSLSVVIGRWARRTTERLRSREEFWPGTGNRETVANLFRNGLLLWILRQYRGKRRRMTARLAARPDLTVIHLRTPAEADAWLSSVP